VVEAVVFATVIASWIAFAVAMRRRSVQL
jgi:hypothetical protein